MEAFRGTIRKARGCMNVGGTVDHWTNIVTLQVLVALVLLAATSGVVRAQEKQVPLIITGGHELERGDFGRPCNLIAAGLGVKPDQFREAFKDVRPAKGRGPSGDEARKNKE